jgi:hypothetical protein
MRRWSAVTSLAAFVGLIVSLFAHTSLTRGVGDPVLPDLRTLPPAALSLTRETSGDLKNHYLLRFDNTVGNWGGPLEIVTNFQHSRDLTQNIYDAYTNGAVVSGVHVGSDLVFHPTHNHFHFQDFATYLLLKMDANGAYQPTTRVGTKTSFCIVDTIRVTVLGTGASTNQSCTSAKQGLSAGWADVYAANTPEQWIDLGTTAPADGDYAIKSTADPKNRLLEADDTNNTGTTYFTIRSGKISATNLASACTLTSASGPVGTRTTLSCVRFTPGEVLDIRWGNQSADILHSQTVDSNGNASATIVVPESVLGIHNVIATSRTTQLTKMAIFSTTAAIRLDSATGTVGKTVGFALSGFAGNEKVTVRYTTNGSTTVLLATLTANASGSASGSGVVPPSVLGSHKIEAKGVSSKKTAAASYTVNPAMALQPNSAGVGVRVGITLSGFNRSETVTVTLVEKNKTLKSIRVGSSGSSSASTANSFTVGSDMTPGTYTIKAVGSSSLITLTIRFTVTSAARVTTIETQPTLTPKPTKTPRPRDRTTATPVQPTATEPLPTASVTATPEPTLTPPTATATAEPVDEEQDEPAPPFEVTGDGADDPPVG